MQNIHFEWNRRGLRKLARMLPIVVRAEWSTFIAVVLGATIYSYGVMAFTVPFRFPDSGVTGIAVLLNYRFGLSLPLVVWVSNALLLAWARRPCGGTNRKLYAFVLRN